MSYSSLRNRSAFIVMLVTLFSVSMIVGCGQNESTNAESEDASSKNGVALQVGSKTMSHAEFDEKLNQQMKRFKQRPQLQQQLQQLPKKQRKQQLKRIKSRLKRQLVQRQETQMLLDHHIEQAGISVSDDEVQQRLDRLKESQPNLEKMLKQRGKSMESVKEQIRQQLEIQKFIDEKVGTVEVSEEEAKSYYEENKEQFNESEQVKARHILIKDTSEAGRKRTQNLKNEIDQGADFAQLARDESEGPSSKRGGSLDYISRGEMVKPFSDAAFDLGVGEVSDPVKTRYGWHLIKVEDRKEATDKSYQDVSDTIVEQVRKQKKQEKFRQILQQLKKETEIVNNIEVATPQRPQRGRRGQGRSRGQGQPAQR